MATVPSRPQTQERRVSFPDLSEADCMVKRRARGELEAEVMDALWNTDEWLTPRAVQGVVSTARRPLAYNTVMTILVRLWQKGMVDRREAGRSYEYRPSADREQWTAERMQDLLRTADDRSLTLQHFVSGISAREAAELRRVLDDKRRR